MIDILKFISIDSIICKFIEGSSFTLFYILKESLINIFIIFVLISIFIFYLYSKEFRNNIDSLVTPGLSYTSNRLSNIYSNFALSVGVMNPNYNKDSKLNLIDNRFLSKKDEEEDLVIIIDTIGKIIYANDIALLEFGITKNEILGESIFDLFASNDFYSKTWYEDVIKDSKAKSVIKLCNQEEKWFLLKYYSNYDYKGNLDSITITGNDVTVVVDKDSIKNLYTDKDYLTGLMNQYGILEKIKLFKKVKSASAFFVQILKFTELTNYYGYDITNKLLNEVVKELKSIINFDCIIARYTESKFVILSINGKNDLEILDKLKRFLSSNYIIDNLDLQIEKKIGYAKLNDHMNDLEELLTNSSIALKEAILSNSNSPLEFKPFMKERLKNNIEIAYKLKTALDNEKIEVFFQKAIDCNTHEIFIIEELSRWNDKDLGYISPLTFFRVAKETNQLQRLDKYMIKKSVEAFLEVRKKEEFRNVKVTLNISPESLLNQEFYEYIVEIVDKNNIKTKDIFVEISESTFMNNLDYCVEMINKYRDSGFMIALDDFGTEYSSLSVLESVDFDIIKIDQHFIKNINKISNQEIIKMIRKLTKLTYREMVAEGVETKEQSELLAELGCSIQQGFYLHKPENLLPLK